VTLNEHINAGLGSSTREQLINWLAKPFGASSFAGFWRYWNPVFGYYLRYAVYQPLRRYVPRWLAVWLTFGVCGVVHGLIALVLARLSGQRAYFWLAVVSFVFLGLAVVGTEALGIRFTRIPLACRWALHGVIIWSCYRLADYAVGG
jgi:hypothetical protein